MMNYGGKGFPISTAHPLSAIFANLRAHVIMSFVRPSVRPARHLRRSRTSTSWPSTSRTQDADDRRSSMLMYGIWAASIILVDIPISIDVGLRQG